MSDFTPADHGDGFEGLTDDDRRAARDAEGLTRGAAVRQLAAMSAEAERLSTGWAECRERCAALEKELGVVRGKAMAWAARERDRALRAEALLKELEPMCGECTFRVRASATLAKAGPLNEVRMPVFGKATLVFWWAETLTPSEWKAVVAAIDSIGVLVAAPDHVGDALAAARACGALPKEGT